MFKKIFSFFAAALMSASLFAAPTSGTSTYYLVGYLNGADSGCEEDYESFHEEYKFVNGSLTTTFTQTSYVFVKTGDNQHWYLSDSYIAPATKVEAILAENNTEKVGVPANVEITFTLTENADGTVTLSYTCAAPEYKYTEYENWQIKYGNTWVWSDNMEKVEDGLFKLEVLWEGTGFNVKSDENPIKKDWFAPEELVIGEEVIAPVNVDVYLKVVDDETVTIGVGVKPVPTALENVTAAPAARCVMIDGRVYINYNGKLINMLGF